MKKSPWERFLLKRVKIEWTDKDIDWPYFTVMSCDEDEAVLRGEDYPSGGPKHVGDSFTCHIDDVHSVAFSKGPQKPIDTTLRPLIKSPEERTKPPWEYPEGEALRITVDQVNHPPHYQLPGMEVIEITKHLNFCRGNAVKYTVRAGKKDPAKEIEDLKKAIWYLDCEIKRLQS